MELSIAYELYMKPHEVDTDTAMQITSSAGFKFADMSIGPFCLEKSSPILKDNWEKWAEKTLQTARKHGITMLQAHCLLFGYLYKNHPDHQFLTDVNMKLLDVCKALEIEYMIFHPGSYPEAVSAKQSLDGTVEWFLPFVDRAEKLGIKTGTLMWCERIAVSGLSATPGGATEIMEVIGKVESLRRIELALSTL